LIDLGLLSGEVVPVFESEDTKEKRVKYNAMMPNELKLMRGLTLFGRRAMNRRTTYNMNFIFHPDKNLDANLSIDLEQLLMVNSSRTIAEQLSLYEKKQVCRIKPEEFEDLRWTKEDALKIAPNLNKYIKHFNQMSSWATNQVVDAATSEEQKNIYEKFLRVALVRKKSHLN
jgi:hypothetical protein